MPAERSSRTVAPRAAPVSRLDLADPRAPSVRSTRAGRGADPDDVVVVHVSARTRSDSPASGLRRRSRDRTGGHAQPGAAASAGDPADHRTASGVVPDRGPTVGDGTDVRPTADGSGPPPSAAADGGLTAVPPSSTADRLLRSIRWYQRQMEGRPSPCRFFPSCSSYAHEAVEVHGAGRGAWLAVRRLLRCRPFGPSGFDPVPDPPPATPPASSPDAPSGASPTRSSDLPPASLTG